jgi:hypothetical protein
MALATYTDLQATIADFLNRQDLAASIPNFIALAEAHFNRTLRTRDMHARVITSLQFQYTQLPDDYRQLRKDPRILGVPGGKLVSVSEDALDELRDENLDATGTPKKFGILGDSIEVWPTPDTAYTMRISYYASIPSLTTSLSGTNWLMTKHPDLYLYTSLLQAAPYLKEDERIQIWDSGRQRALDEIMLEDQRSNYGGTPRVIARHIG